DRALERRSRPVATRRNPERTEPADDLLAGGDRRKAELVIQMRLTRTAPEPQWSANGLPRLATTKAHRRAARPRRPPWRRASSSPRDRVAKTRGHRAPCVQR